MGIISNGVFEGIVLDLGLDFISQVFIFYFHGLYVYLMHCFACMLYLTVKFYN